MVPSEGIARARLLALLALVTLLAAPGLAAPPEADDAMVVCTRQLEAIGRALAAYQRDKGDLPPNLSDLYPKYVSDPKLFHCPADSTPGSPGHPRVEPDPKLPVSYAYEMSLRPAVFSIFLGPAPDGNGLTWRQQKMAQSAHFGDR